MNCKVRLGLMSVGMFLLTGLLTGCVEHRFIVISDPPGAMVLVNNEPIGAAPADKFYVYNGKYKNTLVKDGYETLTVVQNVPARFYEYWPIDFFFENLWPWTIRDVRKFQYTMQPAQAPRGDQVIIRADNLRREIKAIAPPPVPSPLAVRVQPN